MRRNRRHMAKNQQHQRSTLPVDIVSSGQIASATTNLAETKLSPRAQQYIDFTGCREESKMYDGIFDERGSACKIH